MTVLERGGRPPSGKPPTQFQGLYALRAGTRQAGLLELYTNTPPNPPQHRSTSVLDGTLERSDRPSESLLIDPKTKKPKAEHGGPGSLNGSPSPQWISYFWYFSVYVQRDYPGMVFENLGWEDVGGRRCFKVKLGSLPGSKTTTVHKIFWIDLERGGHPLKVEAYHEGKLLHRVDGIELAQVPDVKGKKTWFPVKGEINVYGSLRGEYHDYPIARETYGVVLGSLQINLDLPDSAFVVHTKPRTELANAAGLKQANPVEAKPPTVERPKTDPASVKARLDAALAEADRQAAEVKASSPAREAWSSVTIAQIVIGLAGIAMVGTALVWKRRQS
jgi:hypothetical protein